MWELLFVFREKRNFKVGILALNRRGESDPELGK